MLVWLELHTLVYPASVEDLITRVHLIRIHAYYLTVTSLQIASAEPYAMESTPSCMSETTTAYAIFHVTVFIWGFTAVLGKFISYGSFLLVWHR